MLSSKFLKDIMAEAYPIIKRQLEDAQVISSFRELVTANGGDWSALKALMKAHVEDSLDDSGDGKRVKKILEKADSSNAYADMLGLANMNEKNFIQDDDEDDEDSVRARIAALKSDPAMSIVGAADLKTKSEPQPLNQAGSDLTEAPQAPQAGQVADIQPETANENPVAHEVERPVKGTEEAKRLEGNVQPEGAAKNFPIMPERTAVQDAAGSQPQADKSVKASASAAPGPKYAEPGVITWEDHPPEGVERHEYSLAFGELGQDIAVIEDDLAGSKAQPIVKIGNVILDGWARYMKARSMVGLDGKPVEYPVVQYDGTDPLIDCIRWNMDGRILSESQKRAIVQRLVRIEPKRKADIFKAMDMGMELVA